MIKLPFPPSSLSGHAKGHWGGGKSAETKKYRGWAHHATLEVRRRIHLPPEGDITVKVRFVPPDRRGDRTNYANRMKPYFDGIADALGINDKRFVPEYEYAEPRKPGHVMVTLEPRT